jgi:DHA1 family multidrug resistance protein-like MFS transporter
MALAVRKGHQAESMGSVIAFLTMGHSLGMMLGALFAGLMMDLFALRNAFTAGGLLLVLGVAVFFYCLPGERMGNDL